MSVRAYIRKLQIRAKYVLSATVFSVLLLSLCVPVGLSLQTKTITTNGTMRYNPSPRPPTGLWGICVMDLAATEGEYFCKHHIDLVANAGGNYLRILFEFPWWDNNIIIPSTNPDYAGWTYRDYMRDLVIYGESVGVYIMYDFSIGNAAIGMLEDPTQKQRWIEMGREIINHCHPHGLNVCDEPAGGSTTTDWYAPEPGMITSVQWREHLVTFIEDWKAADPDLTIGVMGVSMHYLNMFYKYDSTIGPGGKNIDVKGEGPLPYTNIVYILNRPGYASTYTYNEVESYLNDKVGPLADYQEFKDYNQTIMFTTGFALDYNDGDYPSGWLNTMTAFLDYCRARGFSQTMYCMPGAYRYTMLDSNRWNWNAIGQAWVDYTKEYI